jgi:hypothetical protein
MSVRRIFVVVLSLIAASLVLWSIIHYLYRDRFFDLYTRRLDAWVSNGGNVQTLQSQVVESCGKLVISQPSPFEQMQLMTFYRDEFDFRVDVCTKMTVNRIYKQPEFEKPDMMVSICDDPHSYHELFRRLCRRSGLRPPPQAPTR